MTMESDRCFELSDGEISIRRFGHGDAPELFLTVRRSLASLSYWLPWCTEDYSIVDATTWIEHCESAWASGLEYQFGIFDRAGVIVGATGLTGLDATNRSANLGYWVGTEHRGNGFARRAAKLISKFAFYHLKIERLNIVILPHNFASRRVAESLGASLASVQPDRILFQGKLTPAVVYSLR